MSRRQAIPANVFNREADPLPPLFPEPSDGDFYFNKKTETLRIYLNGQWKDVALNPDTGDARYVAKAGDTMTGPLVLSGNPGAALEAAPKQYVDGGRYQGAWRADIAYQPYSTVTFRDFLWGTTTGAPAGEQPGGRLSTIPLAGAVNAMDAPEIVVLTDNENLMGTTFSNAGMVDAVAGEPSDAGYRIVWYKYSPATSGSVIFDTVGATGDTMMALYSLNSATYTGYSSLTYITMNDDGGNNLRSSITHSVVAGTTYYIAIGCYYIDRNCDYRLNLTGARKTATVSTAESWHRIEQPFKTNRNYIRNGDMQIAQRGTGSFTTSATYTVDGWMHHFSGTTTTTRQTYTAGLGSPNILRIVTSSHTAGSHYAALQTRIEDLTILSGKQVTLSFDAYAATGSPKIALEWEQQFGSGGSPFVYTPIGTVTLSNTRTRFFVTVAIPSILGKTLGTGHYTSLNFWVSAGSDYATRASNIGLQNTTINLTDVQLEDGVHATPFERLPIQQQLAWCQRYFWRLGQISSPHSSFTGSWFRFGAGTVRSGGVVDVVIPFPVTMRINPNIAFSAVSTFGAWDGSVSGACTAVNVGDSVSNHSANIFGTFASLTVGRGGMLAANASSTAYIDFSAEL